MKVNRKPYHKKPKPKTEDLSDLEVAKKMLKIYLIHLFQMSLIHLVNFEKWSDMPSKYHYRN